MASRSRLGSSVLAAVFLSASLSSATSPELTPEDRSILLQALGAWRSGSECSFLVDIDVGEDRSRVLWDPTRPEGKRLQVLSLNDSPPPESGSGVAELLSRLHAPGPLHGWQRIAESGVVAETEPVRVPTGEPDATPEDIQAEIDGARGRSELTPFERSMQNDLPPHPQKVPELVNFAVLSVKARTNEEISFVVDIEFTFQDGANGSPEDIPVETTLVVRIDPPHVRQLSYRLRKPYSPRMFVRIRKMENTLDLYYDEELGATVLRSNRFEMQGRAVGFVSLNVLATQTFSNIECPVEASGGSGRSRSGPTE